MLAACAGELDPTEGSPDSDPDGIGPDVEGDGEVGPSEAAVCTQPAPRDNATFRIYVATDGDDARSGDLGAPIRTLARAAELAGAAMTPVEVSIAPGTYYREAIVWPARRPTTLRTFPEPGCGASGTKWAIFDGRTPTGQYGYPDFFLRFDPGPGESAPLVIDGIRVRYYKNGVHLGRGSDGSTIKNTTFVKIGDTFLSASNAGDKKATSVIGISRSSDNTIANNVFSQIDGPGTLHALYILSGSNRNIVRNNRFEQFSPNLATIKVRDYSNDNVIANNTFAHAGKVGVVDFFCNPFERDDDADDCKEPANQCPSWNTTVKNNTLGGMEKATEVLVLKSNDLSKSTCDPAHPRPPGAKRFLEAANVLK